MSKLMKWYTLESRVDIAHTLRALASERQTGRRSTVWRKRGGRLASALECEWQMDRQIAHRSVRENGI